METASPVTKCVSLCLPTGYTGSSRKRGTEVIRVSQIPKRNPKAEAKAKGGAGVDEAVGGRKDQGALPTSAEVDASGKVAEDAGSAS